MNVWLRLTVIVAWSAGDARWLSRLAVLYSSFDCCERCGWTT